MGSPFVDKEKNKPIDPKPNVTPFEPFWVPIIYNYTSHINAPKIFLKTLID
jgi:hypothetical protein